MLSRMLLARKLTLVILFLFAALEADARVTRVEIATRIDVLGGKEFETAGAYERITGRVYFSVAVDDPHNRGIVDIANAVNLKNGEVEFSSDFIAVRPKDPAKSNGSMILENPNRGYGRIVFLVDGGNLDISKDVGDAWLLRHGYTIVTLGWQWDATGDDALQLYASDCEGPRQRRLPGWCGATLCLRK